MSELLAAVRAFLEDDVVPALDGRRRFHARVAANVLAIVGRELATEETTLASEWRRLARLLGQDAATLPAQREDVRRAVRDWTTALVECIRRGEADAGPFGAAVRAHVLETVRDKLRVANPEYLARST